MAYTDPPRLPDILKLEGQVQVQDQVLFVTYTIIQRVYNQQWNVSQVRSMDSANIIEYNTKKYTYNLKWIKKKI